MSRISIITLRR